MNKTIKTLLIITSLLLILSITLFGLGSALFPLMFSFGLAYLVFPLVKKLEQKGLKRSLSVPAVFSFIVILFLIIIALILPGLVHDGKTFLQELPANSSKALAKIESLAEQTGFQVDLSKDSIGEFIKQHTSDVSTGLLKSITKGLKTSVVEVSKWLIAILNLFLIPLFFFYVINDYEKLANELKSFIPVAIQPKLSHYMQLANTVLSGYIRGQLMVALALAVLYATGLSVIGLKFGFLIGLLSGLISIIPYAGFSLGFASAIIVALANNSGMPVIGGVISVFVIVQTLEGFIITPKLVGDKVGLSAFATMLVLIIGGNLLGLMGMLLAIPIAAVAKSILAELKDEYQKLDLYKKS